MDGYTHKKSLSHRASLLEGLQFLLCVFVHKRQLSVHHLQPGEKKKDDQNEERTPGGHGISYGDKY